MAARIPSSENRLSRRSGTMYRSCPRRRKPRRIAVFDFIAFMFHDHKEVADIVGILDSISQVRFQHGAEGGLASTLPEPLDVTHALVG